MSKKVPYTLVTGYGGSILLGEFSSDTQAELKAMEYIKLKPGDIHGPVILLKAVGEVSIVHDNPRISYTRYEQG